VFGHHQGLNLTAAAHVVHFDRWWNPAVDNQATDRAFRIGQKRNVMVHKFVCRGTVEERIDAMCQASIRMACVHLITDAPYVRGREFSNAARRTFKPRSLRTPRRYLVTKTTWTWRAKTTDLPHRMTSF
jgi:hypothetical protein